MRQFLCILCIAGTNYAVLTNADTAYQAEHKFLDKGVCGRYEYGCECCTAYDIYTPESLTWALFTAKETLSECEAFGRIAQNNERILKSEGR